MLEHKLDQDLKTALLAGDKLVVSTLRGLKSTILYAKVADGTRGQAMPDEAIIPLFKKEADKRQESADLYHKGGNEEKAKSELEEKAIIECYLPTPLSESEVAEFVDNAIKELSGVGQASMGPVIGMVKQRTAGRADGSLIARLTKERLGQ
jgi:hypothetical protein